MPVARRRPLSLTTTSVIPYEEAKSVYEREPCKRTFEEDLLTHLRYGFVFSTPQFFIIGRPVNSKAGAPAIVDPDIRFDEARCDCWHIYLMAGNFSKAWEIMPWKLPLISFERKNELRIYSLDEIKRLSRPAA